MDCRTPQEMSHPVAFRRAGLSLFPSFVPIFTAALLQLSCTAALAQRQRFETPNRNAPRTIVECELLTDNRGAPLQAQEWGRVFQRLEVELLVRRGTLNEKLETKEEPFGRSRTVKIIGKLNRDGTIQFVDRSFSLAQAAALAEWLQELKTYGAQGAPTGKPAFGLNPQQFAVVYTALSVEVKTELQGLSLETALAQLTFPSDLPIRMSIATRAWLKTHPEFGGVAQPVAGLSQGTALAITLNQYSLGFRPLRTPSGSIELAVEPLSKVKERWEIGWTLESLDLKRLDTAPELFKIVTVNLDNVPLTEVLANISEKTGIRILRDDHRLREMDIDVDEMTVSILPRKAAWSSLLKTMTFPHRLSSELRVDEVGTPFVWIAPLSVGRQSNRR